MFAAAASMGPGWATWSLAVVTAVMAGATVWLGFQSRAAAQAARDTLAQLRREQELSQRPHLVVIAHRLPGHDWHAPVSRIDLGSSDYHGPYRGKLVIRIENVGRRPAVDVLVAYRATQDPAARILVWSAEPTAIGPGGTAEVVTSYPERTEPPGLFQVRDVEHLAGGELDNPAIPTYVLVCRDETGERIYRFSNRAAGFDRWQAGQQAPTWLTGAQSAASWLARPPAR